MMELLFIVLLNALLILGKRPGIDSPCLIDEQTDWIKCSGGDTDLKRVFETFSSKLSKTEKHFKGIQLDHLEIRELNENTFKDIVFDEIIIENCIHLISIDKNAFNATKLITKSLTLPILSSQSHSIFDILHGFNELETIRLEIDDTHSIKTFEINSDAFNGLEKLTNISLTTRPNRNNRINLTIYNWAFSKLTKLEYLKFEGFIRFNLLENSLTFHEKLNQSLVLHFSQCELGIWGLEYIESSISSLKLLNNNITFSLIFETLAVLEEISYMSKAFFSPFLIKNSKNTVKILGYTWINTSKKYVQLDCDDCRNNWLKNSPDHLARLKSEDNMPLACSNKRKINDENNFKDCDRLVDLVEPCEFATCSYKKYRGIICKENIKFDLDSIMSKLSNNLTANEKSVKMIFVLANNEYIEGLNQNSFKDIQIQSIFLANLINLRTVNENAFNGSMAPINTVILSNLPSLNSSNNSIFKALSQLKNVTSITFINCNLDTIPSNAFDLLENLTNLYFFGDSLKSLQSGAFKKLPKLNQLTFEQVEFKEIPDNAFEIENSSKVQLYIYFDDCPKISSSTFTDKSLRNIRRATSLSFISYTEESSKQIKYLSEKVFFPFLSENINNSINVKGQPIDCNDCRNYWLKKYPDYFKRVYIVQCSNGKRLIDEDNFINCKT